MRIEFAKSFGKSYELCDQSIRKRFDERLRLFVNSPFDRCLNNHPLKGKFSNYRSINVTGNWRAIYSTRKEGEVEVVVFELLGTHSQLYK